MTSSHRTNPFLRSLLRFILSLIVALLIALWAFNESTLSGFTFSDIISTWDILGAQEIIALILIIIVAQVMRAWRMTWIFYYTYGNFIRTFLTVFFSINLSFILGGIGFVMRLFILKKNIHSSYLITLSVITMEKLIDFIIAFVCFFFLFTIPNTDSSSTVGMLNSYKNWILIPSLVVIIWFLFNYRTAIKYMLGAIYFSTHTLKLPKKYYYFLKRQLFFLYKSLSTLGYLHLIRFFMQSLMIFGLESFFIYLGLNYFAVNIPYSYGFLVNATIILALLIPLLPSGIGLFQAALVFTVGMLVNNGVINIAEGINIFYVALILHVLLIGVNILILTIGTYSLFGSINVFALMRQSKKEKII